MIDQVQPAFKLDDSLTHVTQDPELGEYGHPALHLEHASKYQSGPLQLTIQDTRPDVEEHICKTLPTYIPCTLKRLTQDGLISYSINIEQSGTNAKLIINTNLEGAVSKADIVQEQGPENAAFKTTLWPKIEQYCSPHALLWSSTSAIPASTQCANMKDPFRLIVVHPYYPPHIMPLLEIVPSSATDETVIDRTVDFHP